MTTIDELNLQNHKLAEYSNVLTHLFKDRSMCDTSIACSVLFDFLDQFQDHMKLVNILYQGLLTDNDKETSNVAQMFMSGERELKRIINQYTKQWCNSQRKELWVADHEQFTKDTQELFEFVLSRIQDETEHLYPLVREIRKDAA